MLPSQELRKSPQCIQVRLPEIRRATRIKLWRKKMSIDNEGPFADLSGVEPKKVKWLMRPLIPYGMVTIMEGDPGVGKSYLAMHIAVQVSIGGSLPMNEKVRRGRVLYMSAEDDPAYTIRPRIDAMGGDVERIRYMANYLTLDDEGIKKLMAEVRENPPALIIIDPLYAYVPSGQDMYRPNVIRSLLSQLSEVGQYADTAMLIIRHLTKSKRDKAIYQGAGSIDVIGAARSAFLVAKHPDDDTIKVVAHVKHNLSEKGPSWEYRLLEKEGASLPIVDWIGPSDLTAEDLLNASDGDRASALDEAIDFLREVLKDGPEPAEFVQREAGSKSISARTLDRAKEKVKVITKKPGKKWYWSLPKD